MVNTAFVLGATLAGISGEAGCQKRQAVVSVGSVPCLAQVSTTCGCYESQKFEGLQDQPHALFYSYSYMFCYRLPGSCWFQASAALGSPG
jgi:hypothetical protein